MNIEQSDKLIKFFEFLHNNPPSPFNRNYDPNAKKRHCAIISNLWKDPAFENLPREERARIIGEKLKESKNG